MAVSLNLSHVTLQIWAVPIHPWGSPVASRRQMSPADRGTRCFYSCLCEKQVPMRKLNPTAQDCPATQRLSSKGTETTEFPASLGYEATLDNSARPCKSHSPKLSSNSGICLPLPPECCQAPTPPILPQWLSQCFPRVSMQETGLHFCHSDTFGRP